MWVEMAQIVSSGVLWYWQCLNFCFLLQESYFYRFFQLHDGHNIVTPASFLCRREMICKEHSLSMCGWANSSRTLVKEKGACKEFWKKYNFRQWGGCIFWFFKNEVCGVVRFGSCCSTIMLWSFKGCLESNLRRAVNKASNEKKKLLYTKYEERSAFTASYFC
jgi:hypothetical protein